MNINLNRQLNLKRIHELGTNVSSVAAHIYIINIDLLFIKTDAFRRHSKMFYALIHLLTKN